MPHLRPGLAVDGPESLGSGAERIQKIDSAAIGKLNGCGNIIIRGRRGGGQLQLVAFRIGKVRFGTLGNGEASGRERLTALGRALRDQRCKDYGLGCEKVGERDFTARLWGA